jgi:MSHA biogenesis protein MshP
VINKQKGINLISVIFLLVVIASIGAFMVTIGNVQQQTSTFSVLSSRALFAAQSGMQWAVQAVLATNDCSAFPANFNLSGGASGNYSVDATCSFTTHTENPDTYNVYRLTAIATLGSVGDVDYISRSIRASVTDVP